MRVPFEILSDNIKTCKKDDFETSPQHAKLEERLRKTLYFGRLPSTERSSLPLTDFTVEFFQDATTRQLGRIDASYAASVSRRACISPYAMMIGMIYVRRLRNKNPDYLDNVTSSDLFLMCMMMASKFHYDEGVDEEVFNDEWAESAHMDIDDLNDLERQFLSAIDWHLFVGHEDFSAVLRAVENRIALGQSIDRGWFSYTDMDVLMGNQLQMDTLHILMEQFCKVLAVCTITYIAGIVTMVLSTVAVSYLPLHLMTVSRSIQTQIHPINQSQPSIPYQHGAIDNSSDIITSRKTGIELPVLSANDVSDENPNVLPFLPGLVKLTILKDLFVHFVHGITLDQESLHPPSGCYKKQRCNHSTGTVPSSFHDPASVSHHGHLDSQTELRLDNDTGSCHNSSRNNHRVVTETKQLDLPSLQTYCCGWETHLEGNEKPFSDISIGFGTSPHVLSMPA